MCKEDLARLDWATTPLYQLYAAAAESSLQKFIDSRAVLSNQQIAYLLKTKSSFDYQKALKTLKVLMELTEVGFYFQKVAETNPTLEVVLTRCAKLYACIENLFTVFRLMQRSQKTEKYSERLACAIRGFLTDISLFPEAFCFEGQDVLKQLQLCCGED